MDLKQGRHRTTKLSLGYATQARALSKGNYSYQQQQNPPNSNATLPLANEGGTRVNPRGANLGHGGEAQKPRLWMQEIDREPKLEVIAWERRKEKIPPDEESVDAKQGVGLGFLTS